MGTPVGESIQNTVVRAFERAMTFPDANIDELLAGAARVARVLADGRAEKPDEYASTVLQRIARQSQRDFFEHSQTSCLLEDELETLEAEFSSPSAILAGIEIQQLLEGVIESDQTILTMRSRGFRFREIALQVGMLEVSVRCRYHLAKRYLQRFANGTR